MCHRSCGMVMLHWLILPWHVNHCLILHSKTALLALFSLANQFAKLQKPTVSHKQQLTTSFRNTAKLVQLIDALALDIMSQSYHKWNGRQAPCISQSVHTIC